MATEWDLGKGDVVIRMEAELDYDTEWFVTLETLRRRNWEGATRVVFMRGSPPEWPFDPRKFLPRAGTEEIRILASDVTTADPSVRAVVNRWRDLLPKEAAAQCAIAYPAVSLDAIGFSSLSGRFLKEVERLVKLRRERLALLAAPTESGLKSFLKRLVRKTSPNANEAFGPSLVEEVVQMIYLNYPHVLVQA